MAGSLKQNANSLYEKNYHGALAENMSSAIQAAQLKAQKLKQNYRQKEDAYGEEYGQEEMGFRVS